MGWRRNRPQTRRPTVQNPKSEKVTCNFWWEWSQNKNVTEAEDGRGSGEEELIKGQTTVYQINVKIHHSCTICESS